MQLSFSSITVDYYPFHKAGRFFASLFVVNLSLSALMFPFLFSGDSCVHWMHYSEATKTRETWAKSLLDEYKTDVERLKGVVRDRQGPGAAHGSPHHGSPHHGKQNALLHTLQMLAQQDVIPVGFLSLSVPYGRVL